MRQVQIWRGNTVIQAVITRSRVATPLILVGLVISHAQAATYTAPRQLIVNDTYQLNPDSATGDEHTTCPKIDLNTGSGGDNPYFQRTNVARAHVGGCSDRYWYTSSFQMLCTDNPPVNTCGDGPCIDEPSPASPQYVDYIPPFGPGSNELTPGRYRIIGEYRFTDSRASYPAEYIVHHVGGSTTVLKSQRDGALNSCPSFEIGTFDLDTGSYVRVNDPGTSSITFNRMRFTLVGGLGGAPLVYAGMDRTVILPNAVALAGQAGPEPLNTTWSKLSGPGTVVFADASSLSTTASFSTHGSYVLRLTADDGVSSASDDVNITVLPQGALGIVITPGNDTYIDQTQPNTTQNGKGILMKGQTSFRRIGLIEFTLPDVEVEQATLNLYHFRSWAANESWSMVIRGKQASFNEHTITWNNEDLLGGADLLGELLMPGGNVGQDVVPAEWRELDITDFFNANRGATVTFILRNGDNHPDKGGTVEDREGSRTGDPANGPFIAFGGPCNIPFADADGDGDVDMDDFASFQRCYTGGQALITDVSCHCFDYNGDNQIDVFDFTAFKACAETSGPAVPADPSCGQ